MDYLKPGMVRTIYERVKSLMYQNRAATLDQWSTIFLLVREGYDREEVEEAISKLYYPAGLFYEKSPGKIDESTKKNKSDVVEEEDSTIVDLENSTNPHTPQVPLEKNNNLSGRIPDFLSIDRVEVASSNLSICRDRDNNSDRDITVSMRSQGGSGPEQTLHEAFVEVFSKLFTLDPKSSFQYIQTMRDKLSKFNELFINNDLMNAFLLAYSEGAVSTGKVKEEFAHKNYKTPRRHLTILTEIIPEFIKESIQIPDDEKSNFPSNVVNAVVYRFTWSTQDPVLNYYRQIKHDIDVRKKKPQSKTEKTKTDPRFAIANLEREIRVIGEWFDLPEHKKNQEPYQRQQQELMRERIKELQEELKT